MRFYVWLWRVMTRRATYEYIPDWMYPVSIERQSFNLLEIVLFIAAVAGLILWLK